MNKLISCTIALIFCLPLYAAQPRVLTATSPAHRVALLELYTSEGCSSCPPMDRFLTGLKRKAIDSGHLIPLAFHVTYWDYIGWKDRFGNKQFDQRQRKQAMLNGNTSIYTPQLMMNGADFRRYRSFDSDIAQINTEQARCKLRLTATIDADRVKVNLHTSKEHPEGDYSAYVALYENNLESQVSDGENKGAHLHHDYVVRELKGPYRISTDQASFNTQFSFDENKINNGGIVAFVQRANKPDILQAVRVKF